MLPKVQPTSGRSEKQLAVFVHGFGSSAECWNPLLKLLKDDPKFAEAFDLACFEYPTQWFSFNPLRRIPLLEEIAQSLAHFLADNSAGYSEITLIGHSQGGLVIQCFLVDMLGDGNGENLENIRQVILVATPNEGTSLISGVRKLISHFSLNPQERSLRVLNPQIKKIRTIMSEKIVNAAESGANTWQIPIQAFGGLEDAIVVPASAHRGRFTTIVGFRAIILASSARLITLTPGTEFWQMLCSHPRATREFMSLTSIRWTLKLSLCRRTINKRRLGNESCGVTISPTSTGG